MSRYRFSLHPKTKDRVEWALEHYPEDKKQLEEFKNDLIPSTTQSYSLSGGVQSGSPNNPTEKTGITLATNPYIFMTEWNIRAVEAIWGRCDPADKQLIDLVYWKKSFTIEGAGMKVGLSRAGAYKRINGILCRLALEMGLVTI